MSARSERIAQPGSYQINVTAADAAGQPLGQTTAHFEVMDQDVEFANPAADPDQMARLADLTRDSGGRAVAPEQLAALLEEIKQHPPELVEEVLTKWQLADTWWDAWLVLSGLVGAADRRVVLAQTLGLGVEWRELYSRAIIPPARHARIGPRLRIWT